jgi:glycosyltransferase involved in cell wall biosynthesis
VSVPWLIVAGDFAPTGGMDRANYHLAWHLAAHCDRPVTLVAHRVAALLADHPRVTVHPVPRPAGRHLLGFHLLDRAGRRAAAAFQACYPQGRILVNGGNCIWPAINWVHLVFGSYGCADAGAPWWFRLKNRATHLYHRRREARALLASPLVITNSEATRRHLIEDVGVKPSRAHCIYLGVDPEQYRPVSPIEREQARSRFGVAGDTPVLLFVGALGYDLRKGFDTLLAALPQLLASLGGPATVLVAGGGALDYWRGRVASLGLTDSVRFLGHVDYVPELLAAADVLVSPVRYEPYGLNVHEAICRGVPAVVSRSAGVAERYPSELAGLLLDNPEDAHELAQRLTSAVRDRHQYAPHIRRLGDEWLAYSWDTMAAAMVRLIEKNAGERNGKAPLCKDEGRLQQAIPE